MAIEVEAMEAELQRLYDALQAIVDIASSPLHWGNEDMQRIIALAKEGLESEV